jgi:hypothetical protein
MGRCEVCQRSVRHAVRPLVIPEPQAMRMHEQYVGWYPRRTCLHFEFNFLGFDREVAAAAAASGAATAEHPRSRATGEDATSDPLPYKLALIGQGRCPLVR